MLQSYIIKDNMEDLDNFEVQKEEVQKYPDAKKHQIVSFVKSGIRLAGYCFIPFDLMVAAIMLFASEVVGVIEELV